MADEALVEQLLSLWQHEAERGCEVAVADLCRDRPELAAELDRRIRALRRMNELCRETAPAATVSAANSRGVKEPPGPPPAVPGYEILGELGRGGMGVVYQARQTALHRLVALKMILSGARAGAADLARFRTEAEAIAHLQHPNIVQIYEIGEHAGQHYIALEFVGGGNLAQKLNASPLPPEEAAALVRVLARAVHYAHEQGVIHRDLKPANILLAPDGTPKVSDFGLAKQLAEDSGQTQTGAVLGTPSYLAPEQAEGQAKAVGALTDVYALGAILYEALTGRPPFRAPSVAETLEQVRSQEPVPPRRLQPGVPRSLETVCLKCLEKEPARRYASAGALAEDLRRFLCDQPILARPPSPAARFRLWCRRPERIREAGAFMIFLAAVLTSWSLSGIVSIVLGFGFLQPPDPNGALLTLVTLIFLLYLPLIGIGLGTIARRRLWIWVGATLSAALLVVTSTAVVGSNPVTDFLDIGGLYQSPQARHPAFTLLTVLAAVQLFGSCVALVAYYSNRNRFR